MNAPRDKSDETSPLIAQAAAAAAAAADVDTLFPRERTPAIPPRSIASQPPFSFKSSFEE